MGLAADMATSFSGPAAGARPDMRLSLGLAFATFLIAAGLAAARLGHGAPDFDVFWAAARHWRAPYDPAVVTQLEAALGLHGTWPFAYPPTFLLFVYPFALLPLKLAYPLWTGLSSALFVFAGSRLIRPTWATAALLAAPPVFFSAMLGQTTLAIGAAMIGGWLTLERRPALAGVLFAIAACIKPQAMILAPIVLWGRWRTLGWMAGAGLATIAASLAFGFGRWLEWPHALTAFAAIAPGADRANPSALIAGPWWTALVAAFGLVFAWRNRNLVGMVGGALCLTPYAHDYDLAPLAPMAAMWLFAPRKHGWGQAAAGGALLAGLVATPAAVLAFLGALTVFQSRWWPFPGESRTLPGDHSPNLSPPSAGRGIPLGELEDLRFRSPRPTLVGRGEVRGR
jgi:hypothetical protein